MLVGVDTGGTFTDVVDADGRVAKVPSTPADPALALAAGVARLGAERPELLAHGTTVATNALLERRGATVALVTTEGLADVIEIARQDRPSLYDLWADRPPPLVGRHLRFEVPRRPVPGEAPELPDGVDQVAVCLLHADRDAEPERLVAATLAARGHRVTRSSDVSPEFREYERLVTTVLDAYLAPVCRGYLERLAEAAAEVLVMSSAGGLASLAEAVARPVALLLSGPAAGVQAAAAAAVAAGFPDAVSFDMGGTSTDVCLVTGGRPAPAAERTVAGLPVRLPALDIHTIGAGGGSLARLDPGGALAVGPASAGADPGPACYGRGGEQATVTDADLVAGRIPGGTALPGIGPLDAGRAEAALARAGVAAADVLAVVDAAMMEAVRAVTVRQGVDPRNLALVAFGGAGPLHAAALAEALGMAAVVVPPRAGVLSAVGLLGSPRQAALARSVEGWSGGPGCAAEARFDLARAAARRLAGRPPGESARVMLNHATGAATVTFADGRAVEVTLAYDCRYAGQSHELTVASTAGFADEHRRRNGYARSGAEVEVTAVRAVARGPSPVPGGELPPRPGPAREPAVGPAVLAEPDCTVWVPPGWRAEVGGGGSWVLRRAQPPARARPPAEAR